MDKALLVLEDGAVFEGRPFGAATRTHGEVVFNTSMTGYQEALTDPSYAGQVLVMTYPLQGNYGINRQDVESRRIQVRGFVAREDCPLPSHWQSEMTLHDYLAASGVPGIAGVDTRALTRRLRSAGVMMGAIAIDEPAEQALARLRDLPRYDNVDFLPEVSADAPYQWGEDGARARPHVAVLDLGVKYNILRILSGLGCRVTALPCRTPADDILALKPDGVVLSPGPGDPALLDYLGDTTKGLLGRLPVIPAIRTHLAHEVGLAVRGERVETGEGFARGLAGRDHAHHHAAPTQSPGEGARVYPPYPRYPLRG